MALLELPQKQRMLGCTKGDNLLTVLSRERLPIAQSCAGNGVCGTCRVLIEGKNIPRVTTAEQKLRQKQGRNDPHGTRYACLVQIPSAKIHWVLRTEYW